MTYAAIKISSLTTGRKEKVLLLLLLILVVLAFHQLVIWETKGEFLPDVEAAFFYVSGTSPQLLYVLVIGLLILRRKDIAVAYHGRGEPRSAMLFLIPGVCLFMWGHFVGAVDIIHVSFIFTGFGTARYLSGKQLTRVMLPLFLILVLATPLPGVLINQIIFQLQLRDTIHSVWLLNAIGMPALAKGNVISMAEHSARVVESCTAMGFIIWLTIFALAYVYIFRITRWHAILLVLSAPFIAYTVNILRALSLVLNPAMEILTIHTLQGIVFFLIGFSLLYAVDSVLIRFFGNDGVQHKEVSPVSVSHTVVGEKQVKLYVLDAMFAVLIIASVMMPKWPAPSTDSYPAITLADELGDWKFAANPLVNTLFLGSVHFSSELYRDYSKDKELVSVFIGADDRLHRNYSLLSEKNGYQDVIGLVQERSFVDLGPGVGRVVSIVTDNDSQGMLTYHWYEGVESVAKEIIYALLALDQSPLRREEQARVTRLATYIELTPEGRELADKRLRAFLQEMKMSGSTAVSPD